MGDHNYINIIDPGTRIAEVDCFNLLAIKAPLKTTYHLPALFGMKSLSHYNQPKGIIILGSGASPNDKLDWQAQLGQWLTKQIDAGTPMLGICYGHQLIAHLLGGTIGFMRVDQTKRTGFYTINVSANRLWPQESVSLLMSHREMITILPQQLENIASSKECPCEGFQHKTKPIWGLQSHPEATVAFMENQNIEPIPKNLNTFTAGHSLVEAFFSSL